MSDNQCRHGVDLSAVCEMCDYDVSDNPQVAPEDDQDSGKAELPRYYRTITGNIWDRERDAYPIASTLRASRTAPEAEANRERALETADKIVEALNAATRVASPQPEGEPGGFTCECCQRNCEIIIHCNEGHFCNECTSARSLTRTAVPQPQEDLDLRKAALDKE